MIGSHLYNSQPKTPRELCEQGNALIEKIGRTDIHWIVRNNRPELTWKRPPFAKVV